MSIEFAANIKIAPHGLTIRCYCLQLEIWRLVDFIRDIFSALLVLLYAFGQNVFDLTVDRAEVLLRPRRELVVQLFGQAQRYLLLLRHISTANRS